MRATSGCHSKVLFPGHWETLEVSEHRRDIEGFMSSKMHSCCCAEKESQGTAVTLKSMSGLWPLDR